jgi:predicted PhzF superfamily epimerase YddE/YHI9
LNLVHPTASLNRWSSISDIHKEQIHDGRHTSSHFSFFKPSRVGNPAGVWIEDTLPAPDEMQRIASDVGFSETAVIPPSNGKDRAVGYCSPEAEVTFCGHATIAAGVVLGEAEGDGRYQLATAVGEVPVDVRRRGAVRPVQIKEPCLPIERRPNHSIPVSSRAHPLH